MKVLSKYIIREITPPMSISLLIFTFVFLMKTIADLAERLIEYQYSLDEIGRLLIFSIPAILGYVIPMSLLLGIIVGLNRLSADSEIISMTSGGISSHSLITPLLTLAVIAWAVNTWLLNDAVPMANQAYRELVIEHSSDIMSSNVKPHLFNEDFPGLIIYINEIETIRQTPEWHDVFIFDNSDQDNPKAIMAKRAWIEGEKRTLDLVIENFHSYTFPRKELGKPTPVVQGFTNTFHLIEGETIDARLQASRENRSKNLNELIEDFEKERNVVTLRTVARNSGQTPVKLRFKIEADGLETAEDVIDIPPTMGRDATFEKDVRLDDGYEDKKLKLTLRHGGDRILVNDFSLQDFTQDLLTYPVASDVEINDSTALANARLIRKKTNQYEVEIHKKFALPFACIIFAMLALPLGLSSRRGGRAYGYVVGITIFIIYWGILSTGENLALHERVSPALGIWAPNILFAALALLLLVRRRVEVRIPLLSAFLYRVQAAEEPKEDKSIPSWKAPAKIPGAEAEGQESPDISNVGRGLRFPPIIDRYMGRTFLTMFFLVFVTVYAVFSLVQFIDINNDMQKNNVNPIILIDYFQFAAPDTIRWIIPISTLMGTMICFGILSKNAEVMAFKASGVSVYRIGLPVIVISLVISMISFYNHDYIIPATAPRLAEIKGTIRNRPVQTLRDPRNRWVLGEDRDRIYYFHKYDEQKQELNELHVFEIDTSDYSLLRRVYAPLATWESTGQQWISEDGWTIRYEGNRSIPQEIDATEILPIPEDTSYFGQEIRPSDQMSYGELSDYIDNLRTYGLPFTREIFDLHWKFSFPFLPLVMTLLGLPFAFRTARKGGALTGVFISISMVVVYWGMMSLFRALGQSGLMPALLAAWAPNLVFLCLGALLFAAVRS
jgi:LPS export ABC transporter permease LptG